MGAAICICSLYKQFKTVKAIDGLDRKIQQEEIFGLLGPNGAGKTTTIRVLLGLTRPTGGHVEVLGFDRFRQARKAGQGRVM